MRAANLVLISILVLTASACGTNPHILGEEPQQGGTLPPPAYPPATPPDTNPVGKPNQGAEQGKPKPEPESAPHLANGLCVVTVEAEGTSWDVIVPPAECMERIGATHAED